MTKREFLDRLERCLATLDAGERAGMVDFYSEQIDDRIDDGMTEAAAVASLESPEDIAANILAARREPEPEPAAPPQAPKESKGFLSVLGKVALWTCAIIGLLIVLPIALSLAAALFCVYLAFWCVVVALGASALSCVLASMLNLVACVVAPVSGEAALVANLAASVGTLGLAGLLSLATYFLGKLLVMIVIWISRALSRRSHKNAAPAKAYPSMPLPPTAEGEKPAKSERRGLPTWGVLLIASVITVVVAACVGLGAMVAAGGPEQLAAQARSAQSIPTKAVFKGSAIDTIDLSTAESLSEWTPRVVVGLSPDDNIHVIGASPNDGSMLYWGTIQPLVASQDGSMLSLKQHGSRGLVMQTFLACMESLERPTPRDTVQILLPQNWKGTLVCDDSDTNVTIGSNEVEPLRIDGDVLLTHADGVYLHDLEAQAIVVTSWAAQLVNVEASSMSINEGGTSGRAGLHSVITDQLILGGSSVRLSDVEAKSTVAGARTQVEYEDGEPGAERA